MTFNLAKALAPELPAILRAAQASSRPDADLVLGGGDILASGIEQSLRVQILPAHAAKFPNVMDNYFKESRKMQELAANQGLAVVYALGGPLLEYNPDKVTQVPTTPAPARPPEAPPTVYFFASVEFNPRVSSPSFLLGKAGKQFTLGLLRLLCCSEVSFLFGLRQQICQH